MKIFQKSMTLIEIIMVVVLVGILATIGLVNYRKAIENAKTKEAKSLLLLIQHAEKVYNVEKNDYVVCASTSVCNNVLSLNLPNPASPTWIYRVPSKTFTTFCTEARPSAGLGLAAYHIRHNETEVTGCTCAGTLCP
ncbi:MAG: prepilin-type N-terminal cleavage/methylation domain-containing protein [Candidatus Omnitrophota bacterium]